MFESQYNDEMAAEVKRLEALNRATAAGHPEWLNACVDCRCRLVTLDAERCGHCSGIEAQGARLTADNIH